MSDINIKEQINLLLSLQKIDEELFDITAIKNTFPERIKSLDDDLEAKKDGMNRAEERLKTLQVAKDDKENELRSLEERVKKHEGELALIKTNKEYTGMLEQIESVKADISLVEEKILSLFDDIEKAQESFSSEKMLFNKEREKNESEKQIIKEEQARAEKRYSELINLREEAKKKVSPFILEQYDRILQKRGRHALAHVEGNTCGECNMQLRPQLVNDAKILSSFVNCENCQRILYSDL